MKIAFVSVFDPWDIRRGSGTFYFLCQELERQAHTIHRVGPLLVNDEPFQTRFLRSFTKRGLRGRYMTYMDPWVARKRGQLAAHKLAFLDVDIILTSDYGIAYGLDCHKPVVIYTDAMIPHRYPGVESPHSLTASIPRFVALLFQFTLRRALEKCDLCIFPAEWQRQEALRYGVAPEKPRVIPFGANMSDPGPLQRNLLDEHGTLHLLFVGKDWKRKGGEVALQVVESLNMHGIHAELHVIGAEVNGLPAFVRAYGLLDKTLSDHLTLLKQVYARCSLMLLPSLSEGSVIAPREAAAYGIPTLAYRIPGLLSSVADGQSGVLLPASSGPEPFVIEIEKMLVNPAEYWRLSSGARTFYNKNANWQGSVSLLVEEMEELLKMERNGNLQK